MYEGKIHLTIETKFIILTFSAVFIFMFWRIGSYPAYFNDTVEHMIHVAVNDVFGNVDIPDKVQWYWTSMHTHGAFESPIYNAVIEAGLRLFGLTLFGVRIFPALIEYLSLILVFFAFRKYFSKYLLLSFISLMALSPWNLLAARSGGIYGFSISLYLIAFSMLILLIKRKRSTCIAILAGISAAIIPYGYSSIRLLLPLIILLAIINFKRIEKYNLFTYISTILVICSIQISNFSESLKMYFFARGEGLNTLGRLSDGTYNWPFIIQKLKENFAFLFNMISGGNEPGSIWNVNVAPNFWAGGIVLYPKFLVPFFVIGLIYCLIHIFKKKSLILIMPVFLFIIGLLPGMLSGIGAPNLYRSIMLIVPIYFLIAYGIYNLYCTICGFNDKESFKKALSAVLLVFILLISVYQVNNYYNYEKDSNVSLKNEPTSIMYREFLNDYINNHPNSKILFHELLPFNEAGYVMIRYLGGQKIQKMIDQSKLKFLANENKNLIERLIKQNYFDIIVTTDYQDMEGMIPDIKFIKSDTFNHYKVYYAR